MAKINPNLLEARPSRIVKVTAPVPKQGEFTIHLRSPDFSELLKIQGETHRLTNEWEAKGDCYPVVPPVHPSAGLWQAVVPVLHLQCAEDGGQLPDEERYSEAELVQILGRVPAVFNAVGNAIADLSEAAQGDLGNDSEAGAP